VATVQVGDRPSGLFGSGHRSHSISWETFLDALRIKIVGQPLHVAIGQVEQLYQATLQLAGMKRETFLARADRRPAGASQPAPHRPAEGFRQAKQKAAAASARAVPMSAPGPPYSDQQRLAALQEFAAAYLELRNNVPLAAVKLPATEATGGAPLEPIRTYELGDGGAPPPELRNALWAHLDRRVVNQLAARDTEAKSAPGIDVDESPLERIRDVVSDHLAWMRTTYPKSFNATGLSSEDSIRSYLESVNNLTGQDIPALVSAVIARLPHVPATAGAQPRLTTVADSNKRFAVQIQLANDTIAGVHIGDRPPGVFGSEHGHHTTAWVVLGDRIRMLLIGKALPDALTALIDLGNSLVADTARRTQMKNEATTGASRRAAEAAFTAAKDLSASVPDLERVQSLASAALALLNTEPLSAVGRGALANPLREAEHRKAARDYNIAGNALKGQELKTLREHLWALLDAQAIRFLLGEAQDVWEAPGILTGETGVERAATAIRQHFDHIRAAYPESFARARFDTPDSLMMLLTSSTVDADQGSSVAIARKAIRAKRNVARDAWNKARAAWERSSQSSRGAHGRRGRPRDDDEYRPY
jgi:hypothetical protein